MKEAFSAADRNGFCADSYFLFAQLDQISLETEKASAQSLVISIIK